MTLRQAVENAIASNIDDETRMLLMALLDQQVDNEHKTLLDECQFVIFG